MNNAAHHKEHCMNRKRKDKGLEALYARLDEVRMSPADRQAARSALAQADAVAGFLLAAGRLARRLAGARPRARYSAT
jgi:hypothetical protein